MTGLIVLGAAILAIVVAFWVVKKVAKIVVTLAVLAGLIVVLAGAGWYLVAEGHVPVEGTWLERFVVEPTHGTEPG